jgi:hypothetical protein
MAQKPSPFLIQTAPQSEWHGYTERNHAFTRYADEPEVMSGIVEKIMQYNFSQNFISMVKSHGVETISAGADGAYTWDVDYFIDTHYRCIGAWADPEGTSALSGSSKPGINREPFFVDFESNVFTETEIIGGENPDTERLWVKRAWEAGPNIFRLEVLVADTKGPDDYIPYTAIAPNTRWSSEGGAVSKYWNDRGIDISFKTPVKAKAELSQFRVQHKEAGHNVNWTPKYFTLPGQKGQLWMTTVEYEFLKRIAWTEAMLIQYGRSNRWIDGTSGIYDKNGYEVNTGSGWLEQTSASNRYEYSGKPNMKEIIDIILSIVIGKTGSRTAVIRGGEHGIIALHEAVINLWGAGSWKEVAPMGDTSGRAVKWMGNNEVEMVFPQIKAVSVVGGIKLIFEVDSSKDDPRRNKKIMPGLGGLVSSYQYDIIGIGEAGDAKSNFKIVRRQGETGVFGIIDGMRSINKVATSFGNPKKLSTALDGFEMHYLEPGIGAKVVDPTKVIKYYPAVY